MYGRPTLSRPVTQLLSRSDVELVVVSRRPDWPDPGRRAALVVPAVRVGPAGGASVEGPECEDPEWLTAWQVAGAAAATAIDLFLDQEAEAGRLTGPLIAREVAAASQVGDVLFVGSSNPIRDLDLAAGPFEPDVRVLANRGLAGIDGTLSTASGVALALAAGSARGQVRCLVGDLTFLHDIGGLLVGPLEERVQLQVVVLDDGGGGIFGLLEHGVRAGFGPGQRAIFERVFATPQQADLAALCAGCAVSYQSVDDVAGLRKALVVPPTGTSVIHVRVDRAAHRDVADRLKTAVEAVLGGLGIA
jgi:2-succinyl-5-enolpyruvyl-6-hydroxy-3-cyclohexene-1-carboxylate synthase